MVVLIVIADPAYPAYYSKIKPGPIARVACLQFNLIYLFIETGNVLLVLLL